MNFIGIYILILLVSNTFEDRKQNIEENLETANKTNIVYAQSGDDLDSQLPENEIFGAEISIIDDNKLSAVITCDTLISKNSNSAILKGNVVAKFYDSEIFNDTNANGLKDDGEWYDGYAHSHAHTALPCTLQCSSPSFSLTTTLCGVLGGRYVWR